ncbi:MAG TPA: polysaccharide biosynthesis/export family protein [Syntrophales bacterium]|nr:polysaccharide biosynthesis/export family protein [Syntrophales bacterium]
MNFRIMRVFSSVILALCSLVILSCTLEYPGIPVKTYQEPATVLEARDREQQEMAETIRGLSDVTENSVFTEKYGTPEYRVGSGDVITINYWVPSPDEGFKQQTYTATVRPDGKISFVYADDIFVEGMTAREIDDTLTRLSQKYLRDPRIEVMVKEFKSKSILIFGRINIMDQQAGVSGPGRYPLVGKTRVLDVIITAGGPVAGQDTGNANLRQVELLRQGKRYFLNIYNAFIGGDAIDNVVVEHGDVINVPEMPTYAERIYVFGQVRSQGILRLRDSNDLLSAIAISGGTTPVAVKTDIKIIRDYDAQKRGKPIILSANLDQILMQGDLAQNIPLHDGDVIYVPRSVIGDINEFIENITPMLDLIQNRPAEFRTNYFKDQTKLRW